MNRRSLRLARTGQLPAPATGDDSLAVLSEAIDALARLRTTYWLGDSAVHLHALASLIAQTGQLLPQAVHHARDQELSWAQIGELLGTTPRHSGTPLPEHTMIHLTRITCIMPLTALRRACTWVPPPLGPANCGACLRGGSGRPWRSPLVPDQ